MQMWADTLFMVCMFLAKLGKHTGEARYTSEAQRQFYLHHKLLRDEASGLLFHGYSEVTGDHLSGARWARANAWVTAATVEVLEIFPESFEGRDFILQSLKAQVEGYAKVQREYGMFTTVLDRPDGYDESSATAGIAYGVRRGVRKGYLDAKHIGIAQKAEAAVIEKINERGEVEGASHGTPIMPTVDDYHTIPTLPTLYGQSLTLLMLGEMLEN